MRFTDSGSLSLASDDFVRVLKSIPKFTPNSLVKGVDTVPCQRQAHIEKIHPDQTHLMPGIEPVTDQVLTQQNFMNGVGYVPDTFSPQVKSVSFSHEGEKVQKNNLSIRERLRVKGPMKKRQLTMK